jgi:divalent metal cation (Fe/Co/Zn/Cd) transporter
MADTQLTPELKRSLGKRAQLLALTSVLYNAAEAIIAIVAGQQANSIALVGFGLDSIIEASSAVIILWQFKHQLPEERERKALRLIAVSFFALALYVFAESVRTLFSGDSAKHSPIGIILAATSLLVMPLLSRAQQKTGHALGSSSVVADSKQTLLCSYLSGVLLMGLVLNAVFGWWWADPLVGFFIVYLALREGKEAWRGDACSC